MSGLVQSLRAVNLISAGIQTGGQIFCLMAVIPAMRRWPLDMSVRVHQDALTYRPENYLRPAAILEIVTAVAILFLHHRSPTASTGLTALGLAGQLANGFISARWEWPINTEVNSWGDDPVAEKYPQMRETWDTKHVMRTAASVFALTCFALAAVKDNRD
jgi:hypothetical protein